MRWVLKDDADEWVMPINPDSMTAPKRSRQFRHAVGSPRDPRPRTFETPGAAEEWQFGGVIHTKAHHDALEAWSRKTHPIEITDHLGVGRLVYITSFDPTDRRPVGGNPWRMRYVMRARILKELDD